MPQFASSQDTIAAVATPLGRGGVGIVRASGPACRELGARLFESARADFAGLLPYRLHHGWALDATGARLDEVLATLMPGPGSYTGEDVLELHCHGGPAVLGAVLRAVLDAGARPAEPGEFTCRAFLNGRLDLTQAEAVAEMIAAPTRAALTLAQAKLAGGLREGVAGLRARLEDLRAKLCVAVDFPDDEVQCLSPEEFSQGVAGVADDIRALVRASERGRMWRDGALCVLAGRVNAGKSSLMNALLGRERAIVTDIPGTTRDWIEEALDLDGLAVRLVDTAGLRETGDAVERAGLERGREIMDRADVVLLVVDRTLPPAPEDVALAAELGPARAVVALNKTDLAAPEEADEADEAARHFAAAGFETVPISARTGAGLDALCALVRERAVGTQAEPDAGELVPNLRQARNLSAALEELAALEADIAAGLPYDLCGVRLETACSHLAEITGDIAPDDVLRAVFGSFCIGK